jgi:basic amino acid/polyamine antiporter, APA family
MQALLRTKSFELVKTTEERQELRRELSATQLLLFGLGSIVGAGIFVLTGTAAAEHAGPAIAISFVLSAVGCLCAGLCYAELASIVPPLQAVL